jgi:hypothetical protein
MSVGGGGASKPEEIKASESEKAQAGLAKDQINYYRGTYAPLEKQLADESNQDYSGRLSGQAGSAAARASTEAMRTMAMNGGVADVTSLGDAATRSRLDGNLQGASDQSGKRLDALGVGLGITADATKSLSEAGSVQTQSAIDRVHEAMVKSQAKSDTKNAMLGAIGSVAGAAGTYYGMKQMAGKAATQAKASDTADKMNRQISMGTAYKGAQGFY